jgi:uncharacterized membrane protein
VPDTLNVHRVVVGSAGAPAGVPVPPSVSRRLAFAVFPLAFTAALLPVLFLVFGLSSTWEGLRLVALSSVSAGRLVLLEAGSTGMLEPFLIGAGVFTLDLCFAFPLAYNLEAFQRLPYVGGLLRELSNRSRSLLHGSHGRKALTYAGLVLFVALPTGGTGAVGGAFFGRLLGLSRSRTLSGIAVGSLIGNAGLALGAHVWPVGLLRILDHAVFGAIGAGVVLVVVGILAARLRNIRR